MHLLDVYVSGCECRRRRGKWLIPIVVGIVAALALRENAAPPVEMPRKQMPVEQTQVAIPPGEVTPKKQFEPQLPQKVDPPPPPLPARLTVTPKRLDFGDGPLSRGVPAQFAVIHNEGEQPLSRVRVAIDGPFLLTNGCANELAPGEQCLAAVVFAPKEPGKFNGSLKVSANEQRAQVSLRGSVPRPPEIVPQPPVIHPVTPPFVAPPPPPPPPPLPPARTLCFDPPLVRFRTTGKQTITLTNPEPVPLRVVAVVPLGRQGQTISGYEIEAKKCLRELKPRQQCKFTIRASQLALQRGETMQLTVYYDDPVTGGRRAAVFSSICSGR
jgi:hypothetical protein